MTIQELYDWAKENNIFDIDLYISKQVDIYPIDYKVHVNNNEIPNLPEMIIVGYREVKDI